LAVKAGESFERNIAYMMTNAGLYVDPDQPHQVKLDGKVVGDIDILAVDPKSDIRIGVSCKNWETNPESKDFNHFISMLEFENITHGVLAWIYVPSSVYPLKENAMKRGYKLAIIDKSRYEELHHYMLTGQRDKIESFFRDELVLQVTKNPTLGQEIELRRTRVSSRRSIDVTHLLPINQWPDPPAYIRNMYFKPSEAKLIVHPYLVTRFYVHKDAKIPHTGEIQQTIDEELVRVVDGVTGHYSPSEEHPIARLLDSHYRDALTEGTINEEGFTTEVHESKLNIQEMVYKMRVDIARSIEPIELTWTVRRGDEEYEESKSIPITTNDIREIHKPAIVNVPIWHVFYKIGSHEYVREFLATDGAVLKDEMARCTLCGKPTVAVCKHEECGILACEDHIGICKTCGESFCQDHLIQCINCKSLFCEQHAVGQPCVTCGRFVCSKDDTRCSTCNKTICGEHKIECVQCNKTVCEEHQIASRYVGVKKRFCSEDCHTKYDLEYRQKGVLGKIGKVARRK
jgi:hypothetical protein